jgi:hypothetical protein
MNIAAHPIERVCRDCQRPFVISVEEQKWFTEMAATKPAGDRDVGWQLPARCSYCRAERRRARDFQTRRVDPNAEDEWLTCVDCQEPFLFGGRDKRFFSRQNWAKPRRCRPCRQARVDQK